MELSFHFMLNAPKYLYLYELHQKQTNLAWEPLSSGNEPSMKYDKAQILIWTILVMQKDIKVYKYDNIQIFVKKK